MLLEERFETLYFVILLLDDRVEAIDVSFELSLAGFPFSLLGLPIAKLGLELGPRVASGPEALFVVFELAPQVALELGIFALPFRDFTVGVLKFCLPVPEVRVVFALPIIKLRLEFLPFAFCLLEALGEGLVDLAVERALIVELAFEITDARVKLFDLQSMFSEVEGTVAF